MELSDALAVAKAQAGDQDAFRVLVERHSPALFRLAYRMTGNEHDAEDVVQESLLRAYRQLSKFEGQSSFNTWLHRIAANYSLDLIRKHQREEQRCRAGEDYWTAEAEAVSDQGLTPDRAVWQLEISEHVETALGELTSLERTAFVLRHFEHCTTDEISRALGIGGSAAKQAVFRAVQKVRRCLELTIKAT